MEGLRIVISLFVWLWDDDGRGLLEVAWPLL